MSDAREHLAAVVAMLTKRSMADGFTFVDALDAYLDARTAMTLRVRPGLAVENTPELWDADHLPTIANGPDDPATYAPATNPADTSEPSVEWMRGDDNGFVAAAGPTAHSGERARRVGFCAHCLHPAASHDDLGCWHVPRGATDVCGCTEYVDSHATPTPSRTNPADAPERTGMVTITSSCPVCGFAKTTGHANTCEIRRALAPQPTKEAP